MQTNSLSKARFVLSLMFITSASNLCFAEEKIIQKEKMSFEQCLKVISVSESKLSIAPKILDISKEKRIAVFSLIDGSLKITCDAEEQLVVSKKYKLN